MQYLHFHKPLKTLVPSFIFACSAIVFGQSSIESQIPNGLENFDLEQISFITDSPVALPNEQANVVFIQQTGAGNRSAINTMTQSSEIRLEQKGSNNRALLNVNTETYVGKLVQTGNANIIIESSLNPSSNLERNITQEGDNHNVAIYGSNSLTKNLRLSLQGSAKTIIIRNFE